MCIMWVLSLLKQTKKDTNSESVMCELTNLKKKKKKKRQKQKIKFTINQKSAE